MKPEQKSKHLFKLNQAKAKMLEYGVSEELQDIKIQDPAELLILTIGILGELAARTNSNDPNDEYLEELQESLQFSARFFDTYFKTRLNKELDPYLLLIGSATYYLCDMPGSSSVLAKSFNNSKIDLDASGLENLLFWLILGDFHNFNDIAGDYGYIINKIAKLLIIFSNSGTGEENIIKHLSCLRKFIYTNGSPRELLFTDVICAIIRKRIQNSVWTCLPQYTAIPIEYWKDLIQRKKAFIKEFWPAQHFIGQQGIFKGKSATIQMPTSAGKTKATEILIRSAFISGRTSLAIIVAPFNALCHEIKNGLIDAFYDESVKIDELSDVLQVDFVIEETQIPTILIVTPEKLVYLLRHMPEIAAKIGLLIFDEGHQFDNVTRGITYELLLTSLKAMVPTETQKILISAVISNTDAINEWLNGENSEIVIGTNLAPTFRSVAFASWTDRLGQLKFVAQDNAEQNEFFVPRVIEQFPLKRFPRERKDRFFPEKSNGQDIALFLGFKLVPNGSIAIFCGRKDSVQNFYKRAIEIYDRGLLTYPPFLFNDLDETHRLIFLYECNLGKEAIATKSAKLGIFSHHNNTPHGIRLAVEYALRESLIRFVICTSTLAQGVNLPIRYLIITSLHQDREMIKIRDFQNLLGRTGRAGMHTEGSILFADPDLYDNKGTKYWRWDKIKDLLISEKAEPCASTLLSLFEPFHSDDNHQIALDIIDFIQAYTQNLEKILNSLDDFIKKNQNDKYSNNGIMRQIRWKLSIISSIESFLMSHSETSDADFSDELAKNTLAYYLANGEQQEKIIKLFKLLAENISQKIPDLTRRRIYGKTLYGIEVSQEIEFWVNENLDNLLSVNNFNELLELVWPLFEKYLKNNTFKKCNKPEALIKIALLWLKGEPFHKIFDIFINSQAKLNWGQLLREFNLEHIVDICQNSLSYEGSLIIGAISELVEFLRPDDNELLINKLHQFQKMLKYGLPEMTAITLYEIGFADRVIAMDLDSIIGMTDGKKKSVIWELINNKEQVQEILNKYPSYYLNRFEDILVTGNSFS